MCRFEQMAFATIGLFCSNCFFARLSQRVPSARMPRQVPAQQLHSIALRYRGSASVNGWPPSAWRQPWGRRFRLMTQGEAATDRPSARRQPLARLEAVLFLAREPLSSRRLARLAGLADGTKARTLVRQLQGMYRARGSAFRVEEVAGGFQLLTQPKFALWIRRLGMAAGAIRLSGPAMETLAVVAYRQPVLRAEIEAIRGVQCGEILRQLMDRDLVRIVGRAEELGRPFLYGTTKRFLQLFGLRDLDGLPRAEELRAAEIGPAGPVAKEADESHDMPAAEKKGSDKQEVSHVARTTMELREALLHEDDPKLLVDQFDDDDDAMDEEEEYDDEDYEDYDEDEDEDEDEDLDEEDEDLDEEYEEDEEDEEELEGDWEEVEDEDEEEEDEEDDDWEDEELEEDEDEEEWD